MPSIAIPVSLRGQLLNSVRAVTAFSPSTLFALNEPGVWYDPSDLTTLFQDTAGTQPVTTPGQTVALWQDKSKGLVLGSELVAAGWTLDTGWAQSDRTFTAVSVASNTEAERSSIVTPGKSYQITVNWSGLSAASAWRIYLLQFTTALDIGATADGASGSKTVIATAPSSGTITALRALNNSQSGVFTLSIRELPGFHATQATLASRPTYGIVPLGGRRNLLDRTEEFGNATHLKSAVTVTDNAAVDPLGNTTADKLIETATNATHYIRLHQVSYTSGVSYAFSVYCKAAERTIVAIHPAIDGGRGMNPCVADLSNGSIVSTGAGMTFSVTDVGGGWYRLAASGTATTTAVDRAGISLRQTSGAGLQTYLGDGTSGILIWGAQLETGSSATAYQRVGSAFDVTEAGVASLSYLSFDGVDDWLVTPTITPGIDKAQVFAGVRKLSDAAQATIAEHSINSGSTAGAWGLFASAYALGAAAYAANLNGSQRTSFDASTFTSPITNVLTSTFDIAGAARADEIGFRVNGVVPTLTGGGNVNAGTGNFTAQVIYIGRRGGTVLPFNGQLYSLIVRFGTNLDAGTITSTETWVNGKTGAYA